MDSIDRLGVLGTVLNLSGSPLVALLPLSGLGWAGYAAGATTMVAYAAMRKDEKGKRLHALLVQMAWFLCWNVAAIITRLV